MCGEVRLRGPAEDVDGEGGDVEHGDRHQEGVRGAQQLAGDGQGRGAARVGRQLRGGVQLVHQPEQRGRLDQLGQRHDPAAVQHAQDVPAK